MENSCALQSSSRADPNFARTLRLWSLGLSEFGRCTFWNVIKLFIQRMMRHLLHLFVIALAAQALARAQNELEKTGMSADEYARFLETEYGLTPPLMRCTRYPADMFPAAAADGAGEQAAPVIGLPGASLAFSPQRRSGSIGGGAHSRADSSSPSTYGGEQQHSSFEDGLTRDNMDPQRSWAQRAASAVSDWVWQWLIRGENEDEMAPADQELSPLAQARAAAAAAAGKVQSRSEWDDFSGIDSDIPFVCFNIAVGPRRDD